MNNPYYVQPADLSGLQNFNQGLASMSQAKQKADLQAKLKEGAEVIKSGNISDIQTWMAENPDSAAHMKSVFDMGNEVANQNLVSVAAKIYENPEQALSLAHEATISTMKQGADASGIINLAKGLPGQSPEEIKKGAALVLMQKAPDMWDALNPSKTTVKDNRTTLQKEYDQDVALGYTGTLMDYRKAVEGLKNQGGGTDAAKYVKDREIAYKAKNPNATKAKLAEQRANWAMEIRRAQPLEAGKVAEAKEAAKAKFAKEINYQTETGKALAQIENATKIIHAQGKLTPEETKANARKSMTNQLAKLAGYYAELDDMKGIVNVDNNTMENIWASIQSSGLGQYVGKRFGAKPQSIRNAIQSMRPQLMNNIRQATNMGARGLDSEQELKFYMQAITDESRDIQSNIAAMIVLDQTYGDGQIADQLSKMHVAPKYIQELKQSGRLIANGALLSDKERTARIKAGRHPLPTEESPATQPSPGQPPAITTQEAYDALPPGAIYLEDGVQYRKPGGQ